MHSFEMQRDIITQVFKRYSNKKINFEKLFMHKNELQTTIFQKLRGFVNFKVLIALQSF